jgi:hypothetical protein
MAPATPTSGQQLVVLEEGGAPQTHRAMADIERSGGQVLQRYGERVLICAAPARVAGRLNAVTGVGSVHSGRVSRAPRRASIAEELGIAAWNLRRSAQYAEAKAERPRDGEKWDMVGDQPTAPDGPEMAHVTETEPGGEPRGIFFSDLSPYLMGSVAVGIVIVSGPTDDLRFSEADRTKVVAEVQEGLGWLATQEQRASVSFAYDIRPVDIDTPPNPALSGYEPLEAHWRDPALVKLGFAGNIFGARQFAERIRADLGTRWAYAAFFTKYPVQHFAYALKPKIVMHFGNDGWGVDNIDRVFTHESGHIFGCPDEYASSNCSCTAKFGWFREPNGNCLACTTAPVECLMAANTWGMCRYTPIHLGWRDIDNDGILDDTAPSGLLDYRKLCSAIPLLCQLIGLSPDGTGTQPTAGIAGLPGAEQLAMPGGSVPMLLLRRTLDAEELARVEQAARAEELEYLIKVERRLERVLDQVREYRSALENGENR